MAAITTAPSERFVTGPLVSRFWSAITVNNGDTITVPLVRILMVNAAPTTSASVGFTISGSTITFVTGGAVTMALEVQGREG